MQASMTRIGKPGICNNHFMTERVMPKLEHLYSLTGKSRKLGGKNKMNEITNKIKALIVSEQEELKDIEEFKNKTKTKLDSDESFSLSTYRMLVRTLAEAALKIDLHKTFIKKLQNLLPNELEKENQQLINQYDLLNKKYCEEMDKNIALIEQLKQSQNQKAIEELEKLRPLITRQTYICGGKATENEIVKANAYNRCLADIRDILDNQIKQLEAQNEV